jgi:hypothetical protein
VELEDLNDRWRNASWSLAGIFPPLMLVVQQLGRLDIQLRQIDNFIEPYALKQQDPPNFDLTMHLTQSYLWVLGVYEIARAVSQYSASNPDLFSESDKPRITALKQDIARLRVPLAKFEPASKHRKTDYAFPMPGTSKDQGTVWAVSGNTVISRSQLANSFLDVYENIRHSQRGDFTGHDKNT